MGENLLPQWSSCSSTCGRCFWLYWIFWVEFGQQGVSRLGPPRSFQGASFQQRSGRCTGILEQTLVCSVRAVGVGLVFPENFGVQILHGPALLRALKEMRLLTGVSEARRAAGFLCQLASADHRRRLGILTNSSTRHTPRALADLVAHSRQSSLRRTAFISVSVHRGCHKPMKGLSGLHGVSLLSVHDIGHWAQSSGNCALGCC